MSPESTSIHEWLFAARIRTNMTQAALARAANVTQATISNIENGKTRNPQRAVWTRIRRAVEDAPKKDSTPSANANTAATADAAAEAASTESQIEGIGELIDFDPHDESTMPEDPGVYVFYDITERPTYIGQSENIRKRIRGNHDEKFWYRSPLVETAAYIKLEDESQRRQVEKLLITVLRSHALINKAHVQRNVDRD